MSGSPLPRPIRTMALHIQPTCHMTAGCFDTPVAVVESVFEGVRYANGACTVHLTTTVARIVGGEQGVRIRAFTPQEAALIAAAPMPLASASTDA